MGRLTNAVPPTFPTTDHWALNLSLRTYRRANLPNNLQNAGSGVKFEDNDERGIAFSGSLSLSEANQNLYCAPSQPLISSKLYIHSDE